MVVKKLIDAFSIESHVDNYTIIRLSSYSYPYNKF